MYGRSVYTPRNLSNENFETNMDQMRKQASHCSIVTSYFMKRLLNNNIKPTMSVTLKNVR